MSDDQNIINSDSADGTGAKPAAKGSAGGGFIKSLIWGITGSALSRVAGLFMAFVLPSIVPASWRPRVEKVSRSMGIGTDVAAGIAFSILGARDGIDGFGDTVENVEKSLREKHGLSSDKKLTEISLKERLNEFVVYTLPEPLRKLFRVGEYEKGRADQKKENSLP